MRACDTGRVTERTWVLVAERWLEDGRADLVFRALPGRRPRVRYHVGEEGPVAAVVEGSLEDAVDGVAQAERPLSADVDDGDVLVVSGVGPRTDPELPTTPGSDALARLQRGHEAVWDRTTVDPQVRGLLEAALSSGDGVVVPCIGRHVRRIVVTDDNRLLVLTELADQPRGQQVRGDELSTVGAALWLTPRETTDSRITVYPEASVRAAYEDGRWMVRADHPEQRVTLSLALDFPAERFRDA